MPSQIIKVYSARPGGRLGQAAAQIVGPHLDALSVKHGGNLTPQIAVADASREASPLHPHFTWDNTEAAKEYRLWEARSLIRSVMVKIEYRQPDGALTERSTQAWVNVTGGRTEDDAPVRRYERIEVVAESRDLLAEAMDTLESRLVSVRREYQTYRDMEAVISRFGPVMDEIDKLLPVG